MDSHDHTDLLLHWIVTSWQFLLMASTAIAGAAIWYLHQIFTTKRATEKCKAELIDSLEAHEGREEKRLDEIIETNSNAHDKIWKGQERLHIDIQWIKNHLIEKNGK